MTEGERREAFMRAYGRLVEQTGFRLESAVVQTQTGQQLIDPVIVPVVGWRDGEQRAQAEARNDATVD